MFIFHCKVLINDLITIEFWLEKNKQTKKLAETIRQTLPKLVMYEMNKSSLERQHVIVGETSMMLPTTEPQTRKPTVFQSISLKLCFEDEAGHADSRTQFNKRVNFFLL